VIKSYLQAESIFFLNNLNMQAEGRRPDCDGQQTALAAAISCEGLITISQGGKAFYGSR
jgi:hypothetical protein